MLIGILSDSHDDADRVKRAVAQLAKAGAEYLIHCGDLCNQAVLNQLADLPTAFVWGNNDFDRPALERHAETLGITALGTLGRLDLGGKCFVVTHGDRRGLVQAALDGPGVDYVLLGHTHVPRDERRGCVRIINPGALFRAAVKTVALLDTQSDILTTITVNEA